jgi:hypothetical protein
MHRRVIVDEPAFAPEIEDDTILKHINTSINVPPKIKLCTTIHWLRLAENTPLATISIRLLMCKM